MSAHPPEHPVDRLAGLLHDPDRDPGLEAALSALVVSDREIRVGARFHATVRRFPGGDRISLAPVPDLAETLVLLDGPLSCLDVETTGLHPHCGDRVNSVAVVAGRLAGGAFAEDPDPFLELVNPGRASSAVAQAVHRLDPAVLAGRPPFRAIAGRLEARLCRRVLVAHNAPFDIDFLDVEYGLLGEPGPGETATAVVDTRVLSKMVWPDEPGGLDALATRLGIDRGARDLGHDAPGDARLVGACLPGLAEGIRAVLGIAAGRFAGCRPAR